MEQRSLHYKDGKSDKFWTISLEGTSHTVCFGRAGTSGQSQTKEFSTESAARKSFDKLIADKLKKGYIESDNAVPVVVGSGTKTKKSEDSTSPAKESISSDAIAPETPTLPEMPQVLKIERSLDLKPEDWLWATWRPRNVLPKPEVRERSFEELQAQLQQILKEKNYLERWRNAELPIAMSKFEAEFWLIAMTSGNVEEKSCTGNVSLKEICDRIIRSSDRYGIIPELTIPISNLVPFSDVLAELYLKEPDFDYWREQTIDAASAIQRSQDGIARGFHRYILPYLTETEVENLRERLKPHLQLNNNRNVHFIHRIASYIGMYEEVSAYIDSYQQQNPNYSVNAEYILGLGSAEEVIDLFRQRKVYFSHDNLSSWRGFLAHTEFSALDVLRDYLLDIDHKGASDVLNETLALARSPETAAYMLELMLASKASPGARKWLENNPEMAVAGLLPVVAGKGPEPKNLSRAKLADAAVNFLMTLKRKGGEPLIRAGLELQPPEVRTKAEAAIFENESANLAPFDDRTTPKWLQNYRTTEKISWVTPADLPPIAIGNHCLNPQQAAACLAALKSSTLTNPMPLVRQLKDLADPSSLDAFVWSLFELWLTEGGSSKEKWAMGALGLLGSDAIALKLAPLIRNWPGESQHPRAVFGLECLRAIGSDTALMQINSIAHKIKYQGLRARAEECMEAIARDRKLTQEQLEDRIVPDCGLDAEGKRVFDFGSRQFYFVLDSDLKPAVKDDKGKRSTSLPKPKASDDAGLAQEAIADWKLFKKQLTEAVKILNLRLENAMLSERRWSASDFLTLLVDRPVTSHLVQRLIWGRYSTNGELLDTFRVSEDRTLASDLDEPFELEGSYQVGIVHPIYLDDAVKTRWGEILSDYEIFQPFPQIAREVYRLMPEEEEQVEIKRFKDIEIPGELLAYGMENNGWNRGGLHDHGDYSTHFKQFPQGVMAVTGDYENQHVEKSSIWGSDAIDGCLFLVGEEREPWDYPAPGAWCEKYLKGRRLLLKFVSPLVISEVLRDLTALTAAAQAKKS